VKAIIPSFISISKKINPKMSGKQKQDDKILLVNPIDLIIGDSLKYTVMNTI
jgi:hypothetical protein